MKHLKIYLLFYILYGTVCITIATIFIGHNYVDYDFKIDIQELDIEDRIKIDTIAQRDTILDCNRYARKIEWRDYNNNHYNIDYTLCEKDYLKASENRSHTSYRRIVGRSVIDYNGLWAHDKNVLQPIIMMYDELISINNLDPREGAEMVVTSVQSVPYILVHPKSCDYWNQFCHIFRSNFICNWHKKGKECVENVDPTGVHSPIEYAFTLKGDCDTRSLYLFTILKGLGYDIVIINSDVESHSILGINLPDSGYDYSYFDTNTGSRYIIWETTSYGFKMGEYPSHFDERNWYIALR